MGIQLLPSSHKLGSQGAEGLAACLKSVGPDLCTVNGRALLTSVLGHGLGPHFADGETETQGAGHSHSWLEAVRSLAHAKAFHGFALGVEE